jgi:hypothetical protein
MSKVPWRLLASLRRERTLFASALASRAHGLAAATSDGWGGPGDGADAASQGASVAGLQAEAGRDRRSVAASGQAAAVCAPEAQFAFRGLCTSVVRVFVGIVEEVLRGATAAGAGEPGAAGGGLGGLEAEWGVAAPLARRFLACQTLLGLYGGLRAAMPALLALFESVCAAGDLAPALEVRLILLSLFSLLLLSLFRCALVCDPGESRSSPAIAMLRPATHLLLQGVEACLQSLEALDLSGAGLLSYVTQRSRGLTLLINSMD